MQVEFNRKSTFLGIPASTFLVSSTAKAPPKRSVKSKATTSSASNGPRWPHTVSTHPKLTPEELSRAGYYYAPEPTASSTTSSSAAKGAGKVKRTTRTTKPTTKASASRAGGRRTKASSAVSDTDDQSDTQDSDQDDLPITADDQCCCFTCGKKLGGWDETDDPYEEHWKRSEAVASAASRNTEDIACAWATAVCSAVIHVRRWKEGSLGAGAGTRGGPGKRTKVKQSAVDTSLPYIYPQAQAHLHPRSDLMTAARQQTYFSSAHLRQQEPGEEKTNADGGWWPHKVKRAWLCTVPNLAKAGFVYTPTTEDKDCVTCFYCNYSVSDWEPTDDPWKQHYDKSPNCPFFTETIEGESVDSGIAEDSHAGYGGLDGTDTVDELADLPTVRSKAAVGSKRPTSRSTATGTKGRRTTATTIASATTAMERSTTRSRIPKTAASAIATPSVTDVLPDSRSTSDNEGAEDEPVGAVKPTSSAARGRPRRGTTTFKAATSTTVARKGTRTTKSKAESTETLEGGDAGPDDFDALPQPEKSKSQSRSKSSKTASTLSASESSIQSGSTSAVKKAPAIRKGVKRTTTKAAVPTPMQTESSSTVTTRVAEIHVPSVHSTAADTLPSPPPTASEMESDTEQEEFDPEERAEYLKDEEAVKSQRLEMVEAGAKEAMAVLQNLSKRANTVRAVDDDSTTPRVTQVSKVKLDADNATSADVIDEPLTLTLEEQEMTVVEYVRRMYAIRRAALRAAGETKIRDWRDKAKQARDFIESIPARDG